MPAARDTDPQPSAAAAAADPAIPTPTPPPDPAAASSYLEGIRDNYSRYVAVAAIPVGSALAFNPGDAVNADHPQIKQWVADGLVEDTAKGKRK